MKKFTKMSLVAAVAVAGFASTASAGALEDAIKNTSILGYATYRYDDRENDDETVAQGGNNGAYNRHKIALGLISKVTEDISYTYVGAVASNTETTSGNGVDYFGGAMYTVYNNFTYTGIANTTIILGQQGLNTPQTVVYDTIAGTQEGTGIAAVTSVGPVTLVAGYMNDQNIAGGDSNVAGTKTTNTDAQNLVLTTPVNSADLVILQAMAKVGPVSLDATYLDLDKIFDTLSVGAKASFDLGGVKLSPYARYTQLDQDAKTYKDKLWYVGTKFKTGIVGGKIAYGETGKNGGLVAVDRDAEAAFQGWGTLINDKADASLLQTNLNVDVMKGLNVAINYNKQEIVNVDTDEVYGQLTWKPAKNFMTYIRYGVVDSDTNSADHTRGRLHVQYTF